MSSTIAPIDGITDDDHSGYILVYIIAAGCFSVLFTILRFGIAIKKHQAFGADDGFFIFSLMLAIIQAVIVGSATHNGLGRHMASLSAGQVANYFKDTYTSRILGATSLGCAKLSICFLYKRLDLYTSWRIYLVPLLSAAGWLLFSVFALALQCHPPSPWLISPSRCPAWASLAIAVTVLNCLSDALLAVFPIPALWALAMSVGSRLTAIALFLTRILVCIMAVVDAIYVARISGSLDPTWEYFTPAVTGVVLVNLSLIIATVPRLHTFLAKLPSGQATFRIPSVVLQNRSTSPHIAESRPASNSQNGRSHPNADMPKLVPDYPVVLTTHVSSGYEPRSRGGTSDGTTANSNSMEEDKISMGSSNTVRSDGIHKAVSVEYHVKRQEQW